MNLSTFLGPADWLVFSFVLLSTFALVIWGNLRRPSLDDGSARVLDMLLMGRRLTLPFFTMTLVATWYGGILPVTEYAYQYGLYSWITQGGFWYLAYLVFAFLMVKRIRAGAARSMPELLGQLFGQRAAKVSAWFNLFNVLPVAYIASLGFFLQKLFGGEHLFLWMAMGTLVVLIYSSGGGLRSVVYSDVIQFAVMCTAVFLVIVFSWGQHGSPLSLMQHPNIPAGHWKPFGDGVPISDTLVWGLVAVGTLVDPNFYQRCLAAKSDRTARNGILLATGVWLLFDFCTCFGALYARAHLPEADSATAYLQYAVQLLPPGVKGFLLAGVLATILSTLDSYLFLAGTTLAHDILPGGEKNRPRVLQAGIWVVAAVALGMTLFFVDGPLVGIWKVFGGFTTACLLVPVLCGLMLPGKIPEIRFVLSCLCAALSMICFYFLRGHMGAFWAGLDPFYPGVLISLILLALPIGSRIERGN